MLARSRALLAREMFPPVPVPGGRDRWVGVAVFAAATLLSMLRVPPGEWNTLWAEDGREFLHLAIADGPIEAIGTPYSGYLHLYPRLSAEVVLWLPLRLAGAGFTVAAAVVVGLTAWAVWTLAAEHLPSPWFRGGLAAAVALLPAGGLEPINSVANSHFYLIVASFWALLACRSGALRQVLPALTVALAALSDPVAAVLLPLALGRLIAVRSWRDRIVALVYLAALVLQLAVTLSARRGTGQAPTAREIAFGYAFRVVDPSLVGLGGTQWLLANGGRGAIWAVAVATVLGIAAAAVWSRRRRLLGAATGIASVTFFVVASLFSLGVRFPPAGAAATNLFVSPRYTLVPALLLLAGAALAAQGVIERLPAGWARAATAAVLLPLAAFAVFDFRSVAAPRQSAPSWSAQVAQASAACRGAADDEIRLLIAAPTPAWQVPVPCRLLRGG